MIQFVLSVEKSVKKIYEKSKLCESDCVKIFLGSKLLFLDDVYARICDLEYVTSIFGVNLLFHKNCITSFFMRNKRNIENRKSNDKVIEKVEKESIWCYDVKNSTTGKE